MSMESFRDPFEDVKLAAENALQNFKDKKEAKLQEKLKQQEGKWVDGPVSVSVTPALGALLGAERGRVLELAELQDPEDFKKKYPDLEKALGKDRFKQVSPLMLGRVDISHLKKIEGENQPYMQKGGELGDAGLDLLSDVKAALTKIAQEIKAKKKPLSNVNYFIGFSRLGSVAGHFGFDTFPLAEDKERDHPSHKLAEQANIDAGMDEEKAKKLARKRPATLAVMPVKKLLELYGTK